MLIEQHSRPFDRWFSRLRDQHAASAIRLRIFAIREQGDYIGDYKSVGDGVIELRFHMGPGYRVYVSIIGGRLIVLLFGGSKSSQRRDIKKAKAVLERWKDEHMA